MSKKALSLTLALVMVTLLCAAALLTACEPPKANASDLDKAGGFFELEDERPEGPKRPTNTPQQKEKPTQQPGNTSMLTTSATPKPSSAVLPTSNVPKNIVSTATPKPQEDPPPPPQNPEDPPESQEGHTQSTNCPKCGGICIYADEVQTPQG